MWGANGDNRLGGARALWSIPLRRCRQVRIWKAVCSWRWRRGLEYENFPAATYSTSVPCQKALADQTGKDSGRSGRAHFQPRKTARHGKLPLTRCRRINRPQCRVCATFSVTFSVAKKSKATSIFTFGCSDSCFRSFSFRLPALLCRSSGYTVLCGNVTW